jgi:hypothetical protein
LLTVNYDIVYFYQLLIQTENFLIIIKKSKFAIRKIKINMYPADIVIPMKEELTENGFTEMTTVAEVESVLTQNGTTLVMINSVCGCSAGSARPGVLMAVANSEKKPDQLATSFAGFDIDAIKKVRESNDMKYLEYVCKYSKYNIIDYQLNK